MVYCISMLLSSCFTEYHYCCSMFCFLSYINMDLLYVSEEKLNAFSGYATESRQVFPHMTKYGSALVITLLSDDQQVNIRKQ